MKPTLKTWLSGLFLLVFFTGTGSLLILSGRSNYETDCKDVQISIPGKHQFIEEEEIRRALSTCYGVIVGERLEDLDLNRMENILDLRPAIKKSEAWVTRDGVLHIEIRQRDPVMKVVDGKGNGYYADADGIVFPLSKIYEADVPEIRCEQAKGLSIQWLTDAIDLVHYLSRNEKWSSRIIAYGVAENDDFILFSEQERIIFGDFKNRSRKLDYLDKYFTRIQPRGEEYKLVNLKYKGQIICRKKDM